MAADENVAEGPASGGISRRVHRVPAKKLAAAAAAGEAKTAAKISTKATDEAKEGWKKHTMAAHAAWKRLPRDFATSRRKAAAEIERLNKGVEAAATEAARVRAAEARSQAQVRLIDASNEIDALVAEFAISLPPHINLVILIVYSQSTPSRFGRLTLHVPRSDSTFAGPCPN
jgi:hypothetical protein